VAHKPDVDALAVVVYQAFSLIPRRAKKLQTSGELTLPERVPLARLDGGGPASSAELSRVEQISPQAMRVTLGSLEARGLVQRELDPAAGRRQVTRSWCPRPAIRSGTRRGVQYRGVAHPGAGSAADRTAGCAFLMGGAQARRDVEPSGCIRGLFGIRSCSCCAPPPISVTRAFSAKQTVTPPRVRSPLHTGPPGSSFPLAQRLGDRGRSGDDPG
jgi:hypothetical protein